MVAGEVKGRAGLSGALGRLAGPGAAACGGGGRQAQAGLVSGPSRPSRLRGSSSFIFLFCFSSSLFEFKFDLEFEFKSSVPHPLDYLDVRPTTLLYILGTLFSYFV